MDFLDPKKQKAHAIRLAIGYTIIGVMLLLGTIILLYQAYGFGIGKNGQVIQNGLVFLSSQPSGASIYVNEQKKDQTNTRLALPAGAYKVQLQRDNYRTWQRAITVDGGSVERFDYPFLFPVKLTSTVAKQYTATPTLATQSLDLHWLLIQSASQDQFEEFDLAVAKPVVKPLTLPTAIFAAGTTTTSWQTVQWANDNRHVLLQRMYQKGSQSGNEFILFDRQDPAQSQNLTVAFGFNPTTIQLKNRAYDQYYVYDQNASQLFTATLKKPTLVPLLQDVLAFQTSGNDLLYVTPDKAPEGKVLIRLQQGTKTYTVHQSPVGSRYLLAVAQYAGSPYIAVGSQAEGKVYVYRDPAGVLKDVDAALVPLQILKVADANYVSFSANSRFVVAENGVQFATADLLNSKGYAYQLKTPLDAAEAHATWMDGYRLEIISGGRVYVFDFDDANAQDLVPANPAFQPIFSQNYHTLYAITSANALSSTPMLTQADQ